MKIGDYEVTPPVTEYNRGFLEGAAWQKGLMGKELEAVKRRAHILELKLALERCQHTLGWSQGPDQSGPLLAQEAKIEAELGTMNLTAEEKSL